jgi:chemotaxis methyl-accepting protein methylase
MILTLDDAQEYIDKLEAENAKLRQQVLQLDQEVKDTFVAMVRHHEEEIKHEVEPLRQQVENLRDFAIWMTGCGYDFGQHEYFIEQRDKLLKREDRG